MMNRRQALKTTALVSAAVATLPSAVAQAAAPFTLPPLPYAFDALEPHIDARTMEIHHDRHHKAYVDNLNKAVADAPDLAKKSVEDLLKNLNAIPEPNRKAVQNQGGGHYNHSLFWQAMKPKGGGTPTGELASAIDKNFGSFDSFKTKFTETAMKVFGSGWAWLASSGPGVLMIVSLPNQDSPISKAGLDDDFKKFIKDQHLQVPKINQLPLLGLDVWEHAYYLKYQNKRADYVTAWWNVVNWDFVSERFARAQK